MWTATVELPATAAGGSDDPRESLWTVWFRAAGSAGVVRKRIGTGLPNQADPAGGALPGRRGRRFRRATAWSEDGCRDGTIDRRGKSRRRRRNDRDRSDGE